MRIIFRPLLISSRFNYFILNSLKFSASFISGHSDDDFYLIISISFCFLSLLHVYILSVCSLLSPPIHFSFYHQRTNINATTCKSAYEWGFSLHRYDLIEYKYLNHYYSHIFHSLFRSLHALRKCKKKCFIRRYIDSFERRST